MPFFRAFKVKSLLNAHSDFLWCLCHSQHIHFAVEMLVLFGRCAVRLSRLRGVLTQWQVIVFGSCVDRLSRLRGVLSQWQVIVFGSCVVKLSRLRDVLTEITVVGSA